MKKKLKPIPAVLRSKQRYIKFKLISEASLSKNKVISEILSNFLKLFGEIGISKMGLKVIEFNETTNETILKCFSKYENDAKTGILFMKKINEKSIIPKILNVSGTIKGTQ